MRRRAGGAVGVGRSGVRLATVSRPGRISAVTDREGCLDEGRGMTAIPVARGRAGRFGVWGRPSSVTGPTGLSTGVTGITASTGSTGPVGTGVTPAYDGRTSLAVTAAGGRATTSRASEGQTTFVTGSTGLPVGSGVRDRASPTTGHGRRRLETPTTSVAGRAT